MEQIPEKVKKHINNSMWYHGAVYSNWDSFCENGILADYNKSTSDALV